jgi:hypothetical protein
MSASYRFIAAEAANYPVVHLCRMLMVSRSGYYGWASRPESSDDFALQVSAVFLAAFSPLRFKADRRGTAC